MQFSSLNELLTFTQAIKGKTFGELDFLNLLSKKQDKGVLGKVVETGFYGYDLNNKSVSDFDNLNVELKVTGFIRNRNGTKTAKERISLSMINYDSIVFEQFNFSSLLFKNKLLLIIWYEYLKGIPYDQYVIEDFQLYNMEQDIKVIENDYLLIQEKVKNGQAHILSEGDTSYLGAATKSSSSKVTRTQPFSKERAKPRAFSLKQGYLTGILRNPKIVPDITIPTVFTIKDIILKQIGPYIGKSQLEIYKSITQKELSGNIPKQLGKMISNILIGKDEELSKVHPLFAKTTHVIKNIPVDKTYYPLERLTFRNIVQSDFVVPWEESLWKSYFEEVTFALICYEGEGKKNGERVLKEVLTISFSDEDLVLLSKSFEMVRQAINSKDIRKLPYPGSFEGQVMEIAPRGKGGDKAYEDFFKNDMTKTCFMISKPFLFKKIQQNL